MKAKTKQICKKIFVWAFYLLVLVFIVLYFKDIDWSAIRSVEIAWGYMALSFAIRMIGLLLQPLAWNRQLQPYGCALPGRKLYSIYAQSWLGRYIPGKVAWVGGKIYFATQEGVDRNVAVITSFLDSMLQVIGSLLVAAVFFLVVQRAPGVDDSLIYLTYALTAALLLCLVPRVFNFLVNLVHKVLKHSAIDEKYRMTGGPIWSSMAIVVGAKILSGIAVAIIALSVFGGVSFADFLYVVAANCAATAIGMAAIFAPAGLGVKESLQVVLLGAVFPREVVLVVVTLASLQSILGDLVFYAVARLTLGFGKKKKPEEQAEEQGN